MDEVAEEMEGNSDGIKIVKNKKEGGGRDGWRGPWRSIRLRCV